MKNKLKVYSWMLYDWACQPIHTLIATFIFGPYFVQTVAENPVEGQALIGMAVTVSGIVVAIFFADFRGASGSNSEKKAVDPIIFCVFCSFHFFFVVCRAKPQEYVLGFICIYCWFYCSRFFRQFSLML